VAPRANAPNATRAKTEGATVARGVSRDIARRRINFSKISLPNLHVVHGAPRAPAGGFDDLLKRSERLIMRQGQLPSELLRSGTRRVRSKAGGVLRNQRNRTVFVGCTPGGKPLFVRNPRWLLPC
jgi:hypothetical protein